MAEQIKSANARIKELEAALSNSVHGPHPLLGGAAAKEPPQPEDDHSALENDCEEAVLDAIGSLSIGADGAARYHGETAGSEVGLSRHITFEF